MEIPLEALAPDIAAHAAQIERERRLPSQLLQQLHEQHAFRLLLPMPFNDQTVAFEDYLGLIEKLGQADASTAWCINQASVIALSTLWLPSEQIHKIWADQNAVVANGPPFETELTSRKDSYLLSGHWGFSSGCQHATWMVAPARLQDSGSWRVTFCRPHEVTFHDHWAVSGLRGTGSFEFTAQQLAIPGTQVADQGATPTLNFELTQIPQALLFGVSFAALSLGIAGGACQDTHHIAQDKRPRYSRHKLREDPDAHRWFGQATARHRAARAYLHSTVAQVLADVRHHGGIDTSNRAELRLAATHVIQECAQIVKLAYQVAGTSGIYHDETLQRRFQDMHVITQHVQAREAFVGLVGRYLITGDYTPGPMT